MCHARQRAHRRYTEALDAARSTASPTARIKAPALHEVVSVGEGDVHEVDLVGRWNTAAAEVCRLLQRKEGLEGLHAQGEAVAGRVEVVHQGEARGQAVQHCGVSEFL